MEAQVTVVIPFYNREHYLSQAVESVFKQTFGDWHLLLVDDGSTDQSVAQLKPYLSDPRVTLIQNKANLGLVNSLNRALEQIETPYFVQLDSDDWFFPHTLEVLLEAAQAHPAPVAVLGGNAMVYVEDEQGIRKMTYLRKSRPIRDKYEFLLSNLSLWPRLYRTSIVKQIGGWPTDSPDQGRILEDRLMLYKLLTRGFKLHWIDQTLYNYRRHSHNSTNDIEAYNQAYEWLIRKTLKEWGEEYQPVFKTFGPGWKKVAQLIPATPSSPPSPRPPQQAAKRQEIEEQEIEVQKIEETPSNSAPVGRGVGTGPFTGPGTAPGTGPGTAPGTGPGT